MKYFEFIDGTILKIPDKEQDKYVVGDTSFIYKHFPVCEHCGSIILSTVFGVYDMSDIDTDLCLSCCNHNRFNKTLEAMNIKNKYMKSCGTKCLVKCIEYKTENGIHIRNG